MNPNLNIIDLHLSDVSESKNEDTPVLLDLRQKSEPKLEVLPITIKFPKHSLEEPISDTIKITNTDISSSFDIGYPAEIPAEKLTPAPSEYYLKSECIDENSMMDTVNPGFGIENILRRECKKPKYKQHLCKENYLGEFKAETEKKLARFNLGVYSKKEVDNILIHLISTLLKNYVTHTQIEQIVADLDFVDSKLKAYSNYEIPNTLFKI